MAPTLTPMKTSTSRSFLFGGGKTVVKRKGHRTQPRSNETEETKTIVFTEGFTETSPFPTNNNDSGMSSGGGKTPTRREANSRSGGGNKMIQLKRRPAINIKNKRRLDDEEDYELFDLQANKDNDDYSKEEDSSPGSRAGQSLADDAGEEDDSSTYSNASEESSDNDEWNDDEILQNTDDEDTDDEEDEDDLLDNNNGQWLGINNNNYDEDDSSVEQENNTNQREIWDLKQVLTVKQIYQPGPIKCQTEKCRLIACCIWSSNLDPNTPWYTCLDCQEKDFKGWPAEGELPLKVFPNELRNAMMDRCTKYRKFSSKKRIKPSMPDWLPTGEEDEDDKEEEEENVSQQFTTMTQYTTQFMDGEEDNGTLSDTDSEAGSVDSEGEKEDQVASMLENVLGSGIASVCRLRKLFPIHFFEKMDFGGTTVTRFDKNVLKAICNDDPYWSEDEDDDKSMVSSFKAQTQKSLSPLTEYTQKNRKVAAARSNIHDHVGYSDQEKRLASEALLILRWTQNEGVGSILREGNLASVIFGISVPSEENSSSSSGELIESYSFNISYNKPDYPEEVDTEEVMDTTGSFFQNLNGFQAGNRSLSQAVVPCKTQGSQYTQASRGVTSQYPTQTQSVDFSIPLSQKHTQASKSQMLTSMSQSQMMASMSQSIRVSVKKNQGNKIPSSRYLTLRVDFTALLKSKELPKVLKQGKSSKKSPIPIAAVQPNSKESKDGFVVTPLGRITENGHSGLCVDMFAETKCSEAKDNDNNDDDDRSDNHSQKSQSPVNSDSNKDDSPLTEDSGEDLSENDTDAQQHFTQHEKVETSSEASPNESASVDEATATQIVNEQCEAEENTNIQVDAKAFGIPFGLGLDNDTYVQCEIREQRTTQLKDDLEVEEFKCCFDSDELEKAGMKKQWIPKTRLMSYNEMFQNVQFYLQFKESKGDDTTSSNIIEEVAQNVRVDPEFVRMLAKKRKAAQGEREEKMKRARR